MPWHNSTKRGTSWIVTNRLTDEVGALEREASNLYCKTVAREFEVRRKMPIVDETVALTDSLGELFDEVKELARTGLDDRSPGALMREIAIQFSGKTATKKK